LNATLERWIREQPECWLWLHRRWSKFDRAFATATASGTADAV
jgi:lauroyl/myristoyl acyltransferase